MKKSYARLVIYTDLDGTFLDHQTYSCLEALPALRAAQAQGVPVVFCSSKTRDEIEVLQRFTLARDPFIAENGGAIYIPGDYFPFPLEGDAVQNSQVVIELGTPYAKLVAALRALRLEFPGRLLGFSDMTAAEIAADCGLTPAEARRAKHREYDEVFKIISTDPHLEQAILQKIEQAGLRYTQGGRYYHLHGETDKGRAVARLTQLFRRAYGEVFTAGFGDSANDLPLLAAVDLPVVVAKPDGNYDPAIIERLPHARRAGGVGPQGWRKEMMKILAERGYG
jgi:mannosyl-3-phosphoglycerate phosphatase